MSKDKAPRGFVLYSDGTYEVDEIIRSSEFPIEVIEISAVTELEKKLKVAEDTIAKIQRLTFYEFKSDDATTIVDEVCDLTCEYFKTIRGEK
jgi:hypothetical protein